MNFCVEKINPYLNENVQRLLFIVGTFAKNFAINFVLAV